MTSSSINDDAAEMVAPGPYWQVAGLIARLQAGVMDAILAALAGLVPAVVMGLLLDGDARDSSGELISPWLGVGVWIGATVYLGLFEGRSGRHNGQRPGKGWQGVRTVRARDGLPIGRRRAWARAALLGLILPGVPLNELAQAAAGSGVALGQDPAWLVAWCMILIAASSRMRRTPIDWLCGTAVVDEAIVRGGLPGQLVRPLPLVGLNRRWWAIPLAVFLVVGFALDLAGY